MKIAKTMSRTMCCDSASAAMLKPIGSSLDLRLNFDVFCLVGVEFPSTS